MNRQTARQELIVSLESEEAPGSGLTTGDVLYVLFRRKWVILLFLLAGIGAAIAIYFARPPVFVSSAKLFVRYVVERKAINPASADSQIKSMDAQGSQLLAAEVQILSSLDLARKVAEKTGPERVLAEYNGGNSLDQAAGVILKGIETDVRRGGNVIEVTFRHLDPQLVQPVLTELIESYLQEHLVIHQGAGLINEALARQADQLRSQLADTETQMRQLKEKAGVVSIENAKQASIDQLARIQLSLLDSAARLAERKAALDKLKSMVPGSSNQVVTLSPPPPEKLSEYKMVLAGLESARKDELELLGKFTGESPLVKAVRERVVRMENQKSRLEEETPQLRISAMASTASSQPRFDPAAEEVEIAALEAKISTLKEQFEELRKEATNLDELERSVAQLQRDRVVQETNYHYFNASLQQARFDEALGPGRVSNIYPVQHPTPPLKDSGKTRKYMAVAAAGGLGAGIAFAFFLELFVDRRIKRATDIEKKLRLPLFLSIPRLRLNGRLRRLELPPIPDGGAKGHDDASVAADAAGAERIASANEFPTEGGNADPGPESALPHRAAAAKVQEARGPSGKDQAGAFPGVASTPPKSISVARDEKALPSEEGEAGLSFRALLRRRSVGELRGSPDGQHVGEAVRSDRESEDERSAPIPVMTWHSSSPLRPYSEALRDRVITYFELRNMNHKPKLVAITSCDLEAGVSSVATGLAAALSETGDGKVLLVDMNLPKGMAHPFYEGKLVVGMSEALDPGKRNSGFVQANLCLATANEQALEETALPAVLPRSFRRLAPRLKASDYDYIIFDMPPVDPTSVTPRLCSFMDMVLMVIESEKTGLDEAKHAGALLSQVQANVACVLNKKRRYVPHALHHDL